MLNMLALLVVAGAATAQRQPLVAIEACDGSGRELIYSSTHDTGEQWFSVVGRVVDARGHPVCGARVSIRYSLEAPEVAASWSPSGRNGEFFLDNVRKNTPFWLVVDPYFEVEVHALTQGVEAVPAYVEGRHNVRTEGLARYVSPELRLNQVEGVVTKDITLTADPEATGVVMGQTGVPGPHSAGTKASVLIPRRFEAAAHISGNGAFVVFGVPPGNAEIRAEIHAAGRAQTFTKAITIPAAKGSVTRVDLRPVQ